MGYCWGGVRGRSEQNTKHWKWGNEQGQGQWQWQWIVDSGQAQEGTMHYALKQRKTRDGTEMGGESEITGRKKYAGV